jgi:preprotein translocase subunit SecA
MNDVYHTFTERFLRAQITFSGPPMDMGEEGGQSPDGSGPSAGGQSSQPPRQTKRFNDFGLLEDIPDLDEDDGTDGEIEDVVDIGPAEPSTRKNAVRPEPVITGAGRVRSFNPVAQAGVAGGAASGVSADWSNVGRNDPCPCGSGKKFKKCHGVNQ